MIITYTCITITIVNVWKKKAKAAFLWFHMRNLSLAGYNCSGGASCMACSFIGESFWNFTVVFRMVWRYAYCFLRILKLLFLHFNLDIFSSLYATDMYREYMPCIGNPAYSFRPILLKLYRYFAAFLWFHMRNLSLAGYNCSGGASCMACSFI